MENFLLKTNEIDNLKALVSVNGLDSIVLDDYANF